MYLTFDEYKNLGGTLDESTFNSLINEAQLNIDYFTFDRLTKDSKVSDKVKICMVRLIELLNTFEKYKKAVTDVENPILTSASNDGVSISYGGYLGSTSPQDLDVIKKRLDMDIRNTINKYLYGEVNEHGKSLLYRGVY